MLAPLFVTPFPDNEIFDETIEKIKQTNRKHERHGVFIKEYIYERERGHTLSINHFSP